MIIMSNLPTRDEAWNILTKYVTTDHLQRHVLMVEEFSECFMISILNCIPRNILTMRRGYCAKKDLTMSLFTRSSLTDTVSALIQSLSPMQRRSCSRLMNWTGLVYACALMRPSKSVMDLELKSVKKKFKTASFAANVNRQVIQEGAERLGMPLDDVIQETILGMRECADKIGLAG